MGKKGQELTVEPADTKQTGTTIHFKPDIEVFTDINIPEDYFHDVLRRQAVVNAGVKFVLRYERAGSFETTEYLYENGIKDYVTEIAGEADKVRELVSMEDLRTDLAMRKALDLVKGAAKKPAKKAKKADGAEGEGDEAEEKPAKKKTASKGKGKAASDSEEN